MLHLNDVAQGIADRHADQFRFPVPGSDEEVRRFHQLQEQLRRQFENIFPRPHAPRTVVVVPSLSLHPDELAKIDGVHHYEERMLCMLMLLRLPRTNLVYLTSQPIASTIVDYYLHLLPGIPTTHARRRLTVLHCYDGSSIPLTQKILDRPGVLRRIREAVPNDREAHITCFNATDLERTLAVRLNMPLYACDPSLSHLGSKSGCREVFRRAGIDLPAGYEGLRDEDDLIEGLYALKRDQPDLRRAVLKLNDGFSGEGNALFSFEGAPDASEFAGLDAWIRKRLAKSLQFEAEGETWEPYRAKFSEMGGIVEAFIEGGNKRSPSVQCRIDPTGSAAVISTHDQLLGGPSSQIFQGCTFPADQAYRLDLQEAGLQIARFLKQEGVLGRFGVDFISIPDGDRWKHYAIEINLRKGGTTHPFLMLHFLTDGEYDVESGLYRTPGGLPRYYYASDNLRHTRYKGLIPEEMIDIFVYHNLHFHGATQQGAVFHLIGALSEFGKLGVMCIGDSPEKSEALYQDTVRVLDHEAQQHARERRPYEAEAGPQAGEGSEPPSAGTPLIKTQPIPRLRGY